MRNYLLLLYFAVFLLCSNPGFAQGPLEHIRREVVQNIRKGHYETATSVLESNIKSIGNDTTGLFDALINLYFFEKKWNSIIKVYSFRSVTKTEDTSTLTIARFYTRFPQEQISLNSTAEIPYKPSITGTPVIHVKVNGKKYRFWLDTGAGMTALSSSTARECNIKTVITTNSAAISATGKRVNINPGLIDSLSINSLKVYDHPCIILDKKDLQFSVLGIQILKIDGIIGWNLLQEFDITLDDNKRMLSLSPSGENKGTADNFFWSGQPMVACTDSAGDTLNFLIDTGASVPGLYAPYLTKADTTRAKKRNMVIGSAGGFKKIRSFIFPKVKLNVGGQSMVLKNVHIEPQVADKLLDCDGVLGINEFKYRTIHFNINMGFFMVSNLYR